MSNLGLEHAFAEIASNFSAPVGDRHVLAMLNDVEARSGRNSATSVPRQDHPATADQRSAGAQRNEAEGAGLPN